MTEVYKVTVPDTIEPHRFLDMLSQLERTLNAPLFKRAYSRSKSRATNELIAAHQNEFIELMSQFEHRPKDLFKVEKL